MDPCLLVFLPIPAYYFEINFSDPKLSIFYPLGIQWYSLVFLCSNGIHCLQWFYNGLPMEYQRSQWTKQYKGIPKHSRNTKGPKDKEYQFEKRKQKEALNPKSRLRQKKKKDWWFFFLWPYLKKSGLKKRFQKVPELYFSR